MFSFFLRLFTTQKNNSEPLPNKTTTAMEQNTQPIEEKKSEWDKRVEAEILNGTISEAERELLYEVPLESKWDYEALIRKIEQNGNADNTKYAEQSDKQIAQNEDLFKYLLRKLNRRIFHLEIPNKDENNSEYGLNIPDLHLFSVTQKENKDKLGIACKWLPKQRKNGIIFSGKIFFAKSKLYERNTHQPIFVFIGIGGEPNQPEKIYLFPLADTESNFMSTSVLETYEKETDEPIRYDWLNHKLK